MATHAGDLQAVIEAPELPVPSSSGIRWAVRRGGCGTSVPGSVQRGHADRWRPSAGHPGRHRQGGTACVALGPALARLSRTFPDRATYLEFWKEHPAFADNLGGDLLENLTDYAGYDLTGTEPQLHPSTSLGAVRQDSMDQYGGGAVQAALKGLGKLSVF
jgi:hypothetical protein